MQDFEVNGTQRSRSLVVDASERNGVIATVAVSLDRNTEAKLFETIHRRLCDTVHTPFADKSADIRLGNLPSTVFHDSYPGRIEACIHTDGSPQLDFAEPTHAAMLLTEIQPPTDETVVIVDGNSLRAQRVAQAANGIDATPPPLVNCIRGEQYYPQLLVADILAAATAQFVGNDSNPPGSLDAVTTTPCERWYNAYNAVVSSDNLPVVSSQSQQRGESIRERIICWFRGSVATTDASRVQSDATTPVANQLDTLGCSTAAEWIRSQ